ncbi:MAG: EFR1 family ferrodoxin [Clostridium sp.]|uniref:EFR1 family ferrodoxin n=1 Tax=Clostridium sp. TaxID=1506 RepID=UPI003F412E6B
MKALIVYFSGTGNTKYIGDTLCDNLEKYGYEVKAYGINKFNKEDLKNTDLLILGGPIYAGNVPEKFIKWVFKNIVNTDRHIKAIVYSTSAGSINANGVDSIGAKLSKKGYEVIAKEVFIMRRNIEFGNYGKNTKEEIEKMIKDSNLKATEVINNLVNGNLKKLEITNKGILKKDLIAELFSIMAKFMGKGLAVNNECIKCKKCVNECPQNNIKLTEKGIKFGFNCMMCAKCLNNCPKNAILYTKKKQNQYNINSYL